MMSQASEAKLNLRNQERRLLEQFLIEKPNIKLFGLTIDEVKYAIDIADYYHPQWRKEMNEKGASS